MVEMIPCCNFQRKPGHSWRRISGQRLHIMQISSANWKLRATGTLALSFWNVRATLLIFFFVICLPISDFLSPYSQTTSLGQEVLYNVSFPPNFKFLTTPSAKLSQGGGVTVIHKMMNLVFSLVGGSGKDGRPGNKRISNDRHGAREVLIPHGHIWRQWNC